MANESILGGFIASLGGDETEYPANGKQNTEVDLDVDDSDAEDKLDPMEIAKSFRKTAGVEEKQDDEEVEEEEESTEEVDEDDDEEEEEIVPVRKNTKPSTKTKDNDDDIIEDESSVAQGLYSMISNKFGFDIDEEDMPDSIDSLVEKIYDIVEENSVPSYASEEISKLDEFVRNGGKIEEYFNVKAQYSVSKEDLKSEDGCKRILNKFLEHQGYSKEQINKKIEKYELAGILEDEAEDGYDKLEAIEARAEEKLLEDTRKEREAAQARQQKQYEDVIGCIKGLTEVNGITISQKEKKELVKYLFEPTTKSGLTQFAEDGKDIEKVVMAAFHMKNGSSLIGKAERKGKSDAYAKIKDGLRNTKTSKSRVERFGRNEDADQSLSTVSAGVNKLFGDPSDK